MLDINKIIVFLFVAILLFYMLRLRFLTRAKFDLKTHAFTILLIGLSFFIVATFLDMIFPFLNSEVIYVVLRVCFTLGVILYIIGVILWSNYTKDVIQKYENLALKDSMTGIYNRNGMEKIYKSILKTNKKFFVIIGDLDGLKRVNDEYGHLEGDRYLASTTKAILDAIENRGYVGRLGGDEFVMVLKCDSVNEVEQVMNIIRESVRKVSIGKSTGISLGYSTFPEEGVILENLIKAADIRMYKEKNAKKEADLKEM